MNPRGRWRRRRNLRRVPTTSRARGDSLTFGVLPAPAMHPRPTGTSKMKGQALGIYLLPERALRGRAAGGGRGESNTGLRQTSTGKDADIDHDLKTVQLGVVCRVGSRFLSDFFWKMLWYLHRPEQKRGCKKKIDTIRHQTSSDIRQRKST